LAWS